MHIDRSGANRIVILTHHYAIKLPRSHSFRALLYGWLNNLNEADAYRHDPDHRCPVLLSFLGLAIVMPRARLLTDAEYDPTLIEMLFHDRPFQPEPKARSYGILSDGELVALDYGWET